MQKSGQRNEEPKKQSPLGDHKTVRMQSRSTSTPHVILMNLSIAICQDRRVLRSILGISTSAAVSKRAFRNLSLRRALSVWSKTSKAAARAPTMTGTTNSRTRGPVDRARLTDTLSRPVSVNYSICCGGGNFVCYIQCQKHS